VTLLKIIPETLISIYAQEKFLVSVSGNKIL